MFNPTLTQHVGDVSSLEAGDRIRRWATEPGSLMVAVGMGKVPAGEWAGHLVAIGAEPAGGKHLVLDATIEQANQPNDGITLRPLAVRVDSGRIREGGLFRVRINDCEIMYRAFPDDGFFEETPAWRDMRKRTIVRDRILERIR